ncbi:MAG: 30S ribosomal protein S7 [Pseudomonadota bacterium]
MPRRREVPKRPIIADPKYGSVLAEKFVNCMMQGGKKSTARSILYKSLDIIQKEVKEKEPIEAFKIAIENIKPLIEVKSRRVGGATYQVPMEIRAPRREALAFRWVIKYSRARGEKTMYEKLAGELIDAFHKRGAAIKKREDTHKMADANKAFAHFRW